MARKKDTRPGSEPCCRAGRVFLWLAPVALVVGVLGAFWARREPAQTAAAPIQHNTSDAGGRPANARPELQVLKGRWLRPDGGYVLEIRQADADGQLDAAYFNPNPIRVVAARATKEGAALKVFIELNDVNYPGCQYNLTYLPEQRQLVGTYFQAALRQTFEVAFEREQ